MNADFIMPTPGSLVSTKLDYIEIKFSGAVRFFYIIVRALSQVIAFIF